MKAMLQMREYCKVMMGQGRAETQAISHLSKRTAGRCKSLMAAAAAALIAAVMVEGGVFDLGAVHLPVMAIAYGGAFTLMVIAMSSMNELPTGVLASVLNVLGRQSYSIYLVHYPLIVIIAMLMSRFVWAEAGYMRLAAALATTVVVSYFLYALVEMPFVKLARHLTRRRSTASLAPVEALS